MNKDIAPALDEISAILKKHDMAGMVMVANKSHVDWRMHVNTTWSCASFDGVELRVRSKLVDYPSREAQKECLESTVGTFVAFHDILERLKENVSTVLVTLSKHIEFNGKTTADQIAAWHWVEKEAPPPDGRNAAGYPMWFGWALRKAFEDGAKWQKHIMAPEIKC